MATASSSTAGSSSSNIHLSYPSQTPKSPSPPPAPPREFHKNRLYVGNLHPSVDEYAFLKVFSKYGKISRMDFLFHKSGPSKGKPRGYAFVEYADKDDANKALVNAHDKLLRGRKLVVTFANHAPSSLDSGGGSAVGGIGGSGKQMYRKSLAESHRPTTLSLIKTSSQPGRMEDKIAALEAKLNQMQQQSSSSSATPLTANTSTGRTPLHPSLPPKPPPSHRDFAVDVSDPPDRPQKRPNTGNASGGGGGGGGGSGSGNMTTGPGKKPTLEELMKKSSGSKGNVNVGLLQKS